jgi:hypothetical protein
MAYGTIKVDTITFTDAGIDKSVAISGLVQNPTFTGNVTVTGTVSGATANFVSGVFTTQISGATVTGGNANFTSGTFTNISGGVYTITSGVFALGTSGTPSISFASDPNTGIYSPGADQVAISTSGTQRVNFGTGEVVFNETGENYDFRIEGDTEPNLVFVDASTNRVGLGTSSPSFLLDANSGSTASAGRFLSTSTTSYSATSYNGGSARLTLYGGSATGSFTGTQYSHGGSVETFFGVVQNSSNLGDFVFQGFNGSAYAERLRINSSGNVGIGTTGPSYALDVINSGTYQLRLASSTSNYAEGGLYLGAAGTGDPYYYGYVRWNQSTTTLDLAAQDGTGAGGLRFLTNGGSTSPTERARIDVTGRLLVGTSTSIGSASGNYLIQAAATGAGGGAVASLGLSFTPDASGYVLGGVEFNSLATSWKAGASIVGWSDGVHSSGSRPSRLVFSTAADGQSSPTERIHIKSNTEVQWRNVTELFPFTDNSCLLGKSGYRWSAVWAANGTIQTSDQRAKTAINDSQLGSEFIKTLRPVSYKWVEGGQHHTGEYDKNGDCIYETLPGTRTHWGFIAQEVKEAVDTAGVDFGGWVLTDKDDPDSQQALRYDQFIAPLTKALQEALTEIDILKAKVAALEGV